MKIKNLFLSGLMCCTFVACSNNDDVSDEMTLQEGDKAYLAISLVSDKGSYARGSVDTPPFVEATEATEGKIHTVAFLFYDANGNPVMPGKGDGAYYTDAQLKNLDDYGFTFTTDQAHKNVETVGNAVIEFKNLTSNSTPRYVLALLNITHEQYNTLSSKTKDKALKEIYSKENAWKNTFKVNETDTEYFVMTNSSYKDGNDVIQATPISASNFVNMDQGDDKIKAQAVEIYVERMAAKVEVIRATGSTSAIMNPVQTGTDNVESKTLNIEIVNWGLNAINNDAYLFKNISFTSEPYTNWNSPENHRSYWAIDNDYDQGTYPTDYGLTENSNLKDYVTNDTEVSLVYRAADDMTKEINEVDYCHENTLTAEADETVAATSVLVIAKFKIGDQEVGENSVLYNYNGVLYDENNYKKAAVEQLQPSLTSIWIKGTDSYRSLTEEDLEVNEMTDGYIAWKLTEDAEKYTFVKSSEDNAESWEASELAKEIQEKTTSNAFKGGLMYYSIPIEHEVAHVDSEDEKLGEYGMVRNHWYKLEISNIKTLGKGIYDPEEIIVPNTDETKFGLATKLNVISWRVIKQTTEL